MVGSTRRLVTGHSWGDNVLKTSTQTAESLSPVLRLLLKGMIFSLLKNKTNCTYTNAKDIGKKLAVTFRENIVDVVFGCRTRKIASIVLLSNEL